MDPPASEGEKPQRQEPEIVQIDPKCIYSALKEFFEPLRTNDPRTDFFALYRRESGEFDRDYARKYDEDLNTSLIFGTQTGLFSAVSSALTIDVQSKLQPDPNEMTAAYMRILIHAMNSSLFPDADLDSFTWTGPPPEIVTVQCLLYASLATSLFAAFLAMLGKQWVSRYLRNCGGSAADKSRDRQRKLDGLQKWKFYPAIESLPVMLQFGSLLLGCALSLYLWTISRTVAGIFLAFTLFGVASYIFFSLAATLYYDCPYQTPPSILVRIAIRRLKHSDAAIARSLRSLLSSLPSIKDLRRITSLIRSGVRSVLDRFGCTPTFAEEAEHIPLAVIVESPTRVFEDISINWEVCRVDARCIFWVLESTTDPDVISSTVRFAADMIWYPEIAGALSPHILADLFFDCLSDGWVIRGKSEHAGSIGMALASVLTVHLNMWSEDKGLKELCNRIDSEIKGGPLCEKILALVIKVLKFVVTTPFEQSETPMDWELYSAVPDLSTTHKLWLSRVVLQTIWRWMHIQNLATVPHLYAIHRVCIGSVADGGETVVIPRANCFLIMAIILGLRIDIRDLYAPNNINVLRTAISLFHQQLQVAIGEKKDSAYDLKLFISALVHLDPFQAMGSEELGFTWIAEILNSGYSEEDRYQMTNELMRALGKYFFPFPQLPSYPLPHVKPAWIPPLLDFLLLCEEFYTEESPPHPGSIALRILSTSRNPVDFIPTALPVLASTLLPTHPLQSRILALTAFHVLVSGWFSPQIESVLNRDLDKLLRAVGDPFHHLDLPLQDGQPLVVVNNEPTRAMVVLMEFASSDLWRNHLSRSNFASFEEMVSMEKSRLTALERMLYMALCEWVELLHTPAKIVTAIRRLEELQCLNTAEIIIMWAWTIGVMSPEDRAAWKSIQDETLRFYQTHGIRRLVALARYIINTGPSTHEWFLNAHYDFKKTPYRVGSVRRPPLTVRIERPVRNREWDVDRRVSRACQLRRLYHLFGYDSTIWRETVVVEEVELLPGCSVTPAQPTD